MSSLEEKVFVDNLCQLYTANFTVEYARRLAVASSVC
jgi:hypothetical protein